ncbi:hypothetical protein CC1G_13534 [Coprinopsis cinerea okayama7|uniref:Tim10-like domain-containing protein n=1 Tax=Coprinopsis cinerea (strain Okayama-7 / 130 / ATCC MYA-4618 / FGSC 9003) TaxID=240176 RepID=A8P4J1_COPC7|nr:hypothetical protein CC1G_13534 [Coprinopsis cinerea okayama7\|eukprot:XP_001838758.2 hypothetical protein CC1G_13534 [Coprinopsis cinerea okayama7\
MVDFFGSSNATLSSADMVAKKEAVKRQIQAETGLAQAQELMNVGHALLGGTTYFKLTLGERLQNSTEKCYARCIVTPGNDLSNKDKTCLASCFDKYLQACTSPPSSHPKPMLTYPAPTRIPVNTTSYTTYWLIGPPSPTYHLMQKYFWAIGRTRWNYLSLVSALCECEEDCRPGLLSRPTWDGITRNWCNPALPPQELCERMQNTRKTPGWCVRSHKNIRFVKLETKSQEIVLPKRRYVLLPPLPHPRYLPLPPANYNYTPKNPLTVLATICILENGIKKLS